jgi:hypothetical protein
LFLEKDNYAMIAFQTSTDQKLVGAMIDSDPRFRIQIDEVTEYEGIEDASGYVVDDEWPKEGHLGRQKIPLAIRATPARLHNALELSNILAKIADQARSRREIVVVAT